MSTPAEPRSAPPPGLWATARELRVLWLTLALLAVAEAALHPIVFRPRPNSLAALEAFAAEAEGGATPPVTDVMLIGSSRFRPLTVEALSRGAGLPLRIVNASFNGGSFDATARLLDRYAPSARLSSGPKLVLIGSGVMDANDGYQNPMVAANLWGVGDLFAHVGAAGTDVHTRAFLFASPPASWSALATAYQRKLLRGDLRDAALRLMGRLQAAPAEEAGERDVLENAEAQRAAAGVTSLADVPPPVGGIYHRNYHLGGSQTEALVGLLRRLRAAGAVPVLIDAPLSTWYRRGMIHGEEVAYRQHVEAVARDLDVALFILPLSDWGLQEADYFVPDRPFDGHHLATPGGRDRFAEALGRLVVAPLWARLLRGEPVGFAQSPPREPPLDLHTAGGSP